MVESTNSQSSETSNATPPGGENRPPTKSALDQVAALLVGDDPDNLDKDGDKGSESGAKGAEGDQGEGPGKGKPGESQKTGKPKSLDDVAERLGVEVKDLYDVEFKMGGDDGKTHTLGALKDAMAGQDSLEVDRLTFGEEKAKQESALMRAQSELTDIIAMLPKSAIKPELVRAITDRREQTLKREGSLTKDVIPEWKDEEVERKDRGEMQEHLSAYGYASNYLDNVLDHRTLKYIRDNMQRQQRIESALEKVKRVEKPGHKPSGKPTKPAAASRAGRNPRSQNQQVSAIAELLDQG